MTAKANQLVARRWAGRPSLAKFLGYCSIDEYMILFWLRKVRDDEGPTSSLLTVRASGWSRPARLPDDRPPICRR